MPINNMSCTFSTIWEFNVSSSFNCISLGNAYKQNTQTVIAGHENGELSFYGLPNIKENQIGSSTKKILPLSVLESKGGPIQCVVIHDVSRLHSNDIVVGDSKGTVTIFCNGQILRRKTISDDSIQCIIVQRDALGNVCVVTGDKAGQISAFNPYADLWRIRLSDVTNVKDRNNVGAVRCLLSVDLSNVHGQISSYVLACDDSKHLYFIQGGMVVKVLTTPSCIHSMCSGRFILPEELDTGDGQTGTLVHDTQVALGSDTGAIYIMSNFEVYNEEYANIQVPIKQMVALKAADTQNTDTLLCCGAFNGLSVVRDGNECARYKTASWIESLCSADIDNDGLKEIVFGCQDRSVQCVKLTFS